MVFRALIPASFCQIILLLLVLKVRSFLEHNPDYCTVDIHTRRSKYCSRVKENMSNMGNCSAGKSSKDDADQCSAGKSNKDNADQAGNSNKDDADQGSAGKSNKDDADQRGAEPRKTIKDFGYEFVKEEHGEDHTVLRHIKTGLSFEFDVHNGDRYMNQQRYEALGEVITEYVYKYLEEELKLKRVTVPVNACEDDPKGFFFMSEDALESEKLMILIHGSGVVRAGQWARSLIINASFESGTMVPYIEQAKQEGYGVLITNGNHNYDEYYRPFKGSENPQDHFVYVWNKFLKGDKCKAKHIVIVAHSFGGAVTHHALRNVEEAVDRIKAVAFTDSVHSVSYRESRRIKAFFKNKARNWASSSAPLDTPLSYYESDCEVVSAGTTEHVWTSHCAKDSVFKYFKEKLEEEELKGKKEKQKEKEKKKEKEEKQKGKEGKQKEKEEKQKEKGNQPNPDKPETQSKVGQEDRAQGSVTEVSSVQEKQEDKKDIIAGKNKEEQKEQVMSEATISENTNEGPNELKLEEEEGSKNDTDEKSADEGLETKTNDAVEEDNKEVTRKAEQEDVEMKNVDADIPATTENEESKNQFDGPTNFDGQQGVGNIVVIEQEKEENEDNLVPEKTKDSEKQQTQKEKESGKDEITDKEPNQKSNKQDDLKTPAQEEASQGNKINEDQVMTEEDLNNVSGEGQESGQDEIIRHTPTTEGDLKTTSGEEEQIKGRGLNEKNNVDKTTTEDELNAEFGKEEQTNEETGQGNKVDDDPMTEDDLKTPAQGEETSQGDKINEDQVMTEEDLNNVSGEGQESGQDEIIEHTPTTEGDLKTTSGEEEQIKGRGLDEKNNVDKTTTEDELNAEFGKEEQTNKETGQGDKVDDDLMTEDGLKTLDSNPSIVAVQDPDENTAGTPEGIDVEMKDEERKDNDEVQQPMD